MENIKIAIQKSGRLFDDSIKLLKSCGIYYNDGKQQLKVTADNFPMEIFLLRNADIPQYLEDGVVDIAIIGENLLIEKEKEAEIVEHLGFSKCRVSLAVPKSVDFDGLDWLQNKKIATSYANTVKQFLKEHNLNAEIHTISGSVEIAPNIGLADCICDIVSSGSTLFKNGLKEVYTLFQSQAVIAKNLNLSKEKERVLDDFLFRVKAVLKAKHTKYILLNAPKEKVDEIVKILPVLKSPTILPLADKDWCSIHSVIEEKRFWEVINELKNTGAKDILVIPIDKMVY